jgi:hypothetical protein
MRGSIAIALIVVGGCLLLGPLVINAYNSNRDKDRVAEFYSRTSNAAVLPKNLTLSAFTAYDWGCFIVGAIMAGMGIVRSRPNALSHS